MGLGVWWLGAMVSVGGVVRAAPAETTDAAEQTVERGARTSAVLEAVVRSHYLTGETLLVPVTLRNPTDEATTVPDLRVRPWLVTFQLRLPNGNIQTRRTARPERDAGQTLLLRPKQQRTVLLEVPSGAALGAGAYELGVTVDVGQEEPLLLPPVVVEIAAARPVAGDTARANAGATAVDTVWVNGLADGAQLYLHQSNPSRPADSRGEWFLAEVRAGVKPRLTVSRGVDVLNRAVVWLEGERRLSFLRLEGVVAAAETSHRTLPWPKVELAGSPALDGGGAVLIPIWVPNPDGVSGSLQLVSIDAKGHLSYRKFVDLKRRPSSDLGVTVDGAGNVHFLLVGSTSIDLYTARSGGPGESGLPVPGRAIFRAKESSVVEGADFGVLRESEGIKGGLSILAAVSSSDRLDLQWLGLRGQQLGSATPGLWSAGERLLAMLPNDVSPPLLVVRTLQDGPVVRAGETQTSLPGGSGGDWGLLRTSEGQALLRRIGHGDTVGFIEL